jgi:hypothetical protein
MRGECCWLDMMDLLQRMEPVAQGKELAVAKKGHIDNE